MYIRALFSFLFMSKSLKDGSQSSEILKGFSGGRLARHSSELRQGHMHTTLLYRHF